MLIDMGIKKVKKSPLLSIRASSFVEEIYISSH
jgi:hypothetical protein